METQEELNSQLLEASKKGDTETVLSLLSQGADIGARGQSIYGWTALMLASYYDRIELVKVLLEQGADINAKDKDDYTAINNSLGSWSHRDG